MTPRTAEPFWDLVEESLEEAAFLWRRWETDLQSLTRNLDEVWSWTEDRLHGALDGVRVAGDSLCERFLAPALSGEDASRIIIAAHISAAHSPTDARDLLAATVRTSTGAKLQQLMRGIEVADLNGSFAPINAVLTTAGAEHHAALCRLKLFRRAAVGAEALDAFQSNVPELQLHAVRAAHLAAEQPANQLISSGLKHSDLKVRHAAVEAGIRRRMTAAWAEAVQLAKGAADQAGPLLPLVAMLGGPQEHEIVFAALQKPELRKHALWALGFVGTRKAAEACLDAMQDKESARPAGEAYCAITGAELERDRLAAPEPSDDGEPVAFEADDLDADLVPAADALWPLPDVPAVRRHWESLGSAIAPNTRYLRGKQVAMNTLIAAVESGPMLRRAELLIEVAVRSGGQYDVEPRAFRHAQCAMMQKGRGAGAA